MGANEKETLKIKNNDFTSAVFQVYFQGGIQYTGEKGWGMILKAVYRQQLSNTYSKYNAYIHKANAMGSNVPRTAVQPPANGSAPGIPPTITARDDRCFMGV